MNVPKVTVIIPHFNGEQILRRCLETIRLSTFNDFQVLMVDNCSTDRSVQIVKSEFPHVNIIQNRKNLGYAGACNLGIQLSKSKYIVLLNNDTKVVPGWLEVLVEAADSDSKIGAVQPKILSIQNPDKFDYCGAAGGEIDIFGYPFARGRIFYSIEKDINQYDTPSEVFWATGAASLIRRSALDKIGLLEQSFFAHMEEIDLNWRLHLAGYKVVTAPQALVYHQTGGTLGEDKFMKMLFNHRNNLLMILRNFSIVTLLWILPVRLFLELVTIFVFLLKKNPKRSVAVIAGFAGVLTHFKCVIKGRKKVNSIRIVKENRILKKMYRGSIAFDFFIKKINKADQLKNIN